MSDAVQRRSEAPVLVGRTGELHALLDAITHPPSVALVEGEAGIGKTRLIREALRHPSVRARRILLGSCHPLREPFPYGPVFELLRGLDGGLPDGLSPVCGALRPYLPELAGLLPPAPEPLEDHRARQHRLFRAVRALLAALGDVVVVVEDLHWADDGTRDLVRFLVDEPPAGLSAVLSYRREDLPGTGLPLGRAYRHPPGTTAVLIPLQVLDVHAVRSLTAAITGNSDIPGPLAAALLERTAGIPFVLEEVIRALPGADGLSDPGSGRAALENVQVPMLLQEAITDRMAVLSPAASDAVRAVAVLRVPVDEELLAAVTGTSRAEAGESVREALLAGVLHEYGDGRYGFRHALAQQAVYAGLPGPDRHRLHREVMVVLAAREAPPLVQLAYHARRAGALAEWHRYGEAAAEAAREMGDIALAVELLEELLSDARLDPLELGRLAAQLSRDAVAGLSHRRACALLRRVVGESQLPDALRGEIRLHLGLLLYNQAGDHEAGRADTEIAVEELRDRPELAARGMAALAMPSWGDHPYQVYERWITRAEELAERGDDPEALMAVRGNHLALRMSLGDSSVWARAEELLGQGGSVAERRQIARSCGNFADAATSLGHYAKGQRYRAEGWRLAAECGAPYTEGIVEGTGLRLDWYAGRWQGLAERARHTLDVVQGVSGIAADAHLVLGMLALARGEWEEAAARLDAAGLADPANAPAPILATAAGMMARLRVSRGELSGACAEAERGVARIRRKGIWPWAGDLAPAAVGALVRGGRTDDAARLADEFEAGVAGRDAPLAAAAVWACRGLVAGARGRHEEAAAALGEARARYAALPQPYAAARAAEAAARSRIAAAGERDAGADGGEAGARTGAGPRTGADGSIRTGETAAATAELAALAEEFTELGAARDAARCRRAVRGSGVTLPSRRGRRGYGDQLSPREDDVARLVALGHTNREIADVLYLSPRTVEQHVAKVLRKLNAASRSEVAALRTGRDPAGRT
ncbi:LuxR family transcriptional regulator [Streptomyces armeniacus]|uniref:LuxR family transcriptional regulator n=1 Tax=Streptomyces armeniacus TaxID=83291 RepID=A0A345XN11_9ACTN|nr:LuxR family transcriptional regulator [Streptomyces armeniacus]AXK33027.1 LuxR family transcriptional regulator [Streptomyces armeniacus]